MAIILLAFGPCVVVIYGWDMLCIWVDLPVQRRLCPIFVSGVGYPTFTSIPRVDGLSMRHPSFGASQPVGTLQNITELLLFHIIHVHNI